MMIGSGERGPHERDESRRDTNLPPDVFEVEDGGVRLERGHERLKLRYFDEGARRDDERDLRTAARRKELAIRTALGALRGRLIRQIVTEACVLATGGAILGLVLAYWATGFFIAIGGDSIPRPEAIAIDAWVLAFTVVILSPEMK